jgi:hypothetical protein
MSVLKKHGFTLVGTRYFNSAPQGDGGSIMLKVLVTDSFDSKIDVSWTTHNVAARSHEYHSKLFDLSDYQEVIQFVLDLTKSVDTIYEAADTHDIIDQALDLVGNRIGERRVKTDFGFVEVNNKFSSGYYFSAHKDDDSIPFIDTYNHSVKTPQELADLLHAFIEVAAAVIPLIDRLIDALPMMDYEDDLLIRDNVAVGVVMYGFTVKIVVRNDIDDDEKYFHADEFDLAVAYAKEQMKKPLNESWKSHEYRELTNSAAAALKNRGHQADLYAANVINLNVNNLRMVLHFYVPR